MAFQMLSHIYILLAVICQSQTQLPEINTTAVAVADAPDEILANFQKAFPPSKELTNAELANVSIWNDNVARKLQELDLKFNVMPSENMLVCAPASIALLAYLMHIANVVPAFDLIGTRKRIIQASFGSALEQIRQEADSAFEAADNSMDTIRHTLEAIPKLAQTIEGIVQLDDPRIFQQELRSPLADLSSIAASCSAAAKAAAAKFSEVQQTIGELMLLLSSTRDTHSQQKSEIEATLAVVQKAHEGTESMIAMLDKELEKLKKDAAERKLAYDKAIKDIPKGWDAVGQDVVRGIDITGICQGFFKALAGYFTAKAGMAMTAMSSIAQLAGRGGFSGEAQAGLLAAMGLHGSVIQKEAQKFSETDKQEGDLDDLMKTHNLTIEQVKELIKNSKDSRHFHKAEKILDESQDIAKAHLKAKAKADEKRKRASGDTPEPTIHDDPLILDPSTGASDPFTQLRGVDENAKKLKQALQLDDPSTAEGSRGFITKSATQQQTNAGNERWIAATQKQLLEAVEQRQDRQFEKLTKYTDVLNQETQQITNLTLNEHKHSEIIAATLKAIHATSLLANQWKGLVLFFIGFQRIIDHNLADEATAYTEAVVEAIDRAAAANYSKGAYIDPLRNHINKQGQKLEIVALVISSISSDFSDMSVRHIRPALDELAKMRTYETAGESMRALLGHLSRAKAAAGDIKKLCLKHRTEVQDHVMEQSRVIEAIAHVTGHLDERKKKLLEEVKKKVDEEANE